MDNQPVKMGEYYQTLRKTLKKMVRHVYGNRAIVLNFKVVKETEPWVYIVANILTKDRYLKVWAVYDQIFEEMVFNAEDVKGIQTKLNI